MKQKIKTLSVTILVILALAGTGFLLFQYEMGFFPGEKERLKASGKSMADKIEHFKRVNERYPSSLEEAGITNTATRFGCWTYWLGKTNWYNIALNSADHGYNLTYIPIDSQHPEAGSPAIWSERPICEVIHHRAIKKVSATWYQHKEGISGIWYVKFNILRGTRINLALLLVSLSACIVGLIYIVRRMDEMAFGILEIIWLLCLLRMSVNLLLFMWFVGSGQSGAFQAPNIAFEMAVALAIPAMDASLLSAMLLLSSVIRAKMISTVKCHCVIGLATGVVSIALLHYWMVYWLTVKRWY